MASSAFPSIMRAISDSGSSGGRACVVLFITGVGFGVLSDSFQTVLIGSFLIILFNFILNKQPSLRADVLDNGHGIYARPLKRHFGSIAPRERRDKCGGIRIASAGALIGRF